MTGRQCCACARQRPATRTIVSTQTSSTRYCSTTEHLEICSRLSYDARASRGSGEALVTARSQVSPTWQTGSVAATPVLTFIGGADKSWACRDPQEIAALDCSTDGATRGFGLNELEQGDVQLLNNFVPCRRTAYEDKPEPNAPIFLGYASLVKVALEHRK